MTKRDNDRQLNTESRNDCGKIAYTTRSAAKRHASSIRARIGSHLRPYRCQWCDLWHVGHLPKAVLEGTIGSEVYYGRAEPTEATG